MDGDCSPALSFVLLLRRDSTNDLIVSHARPSCRRKGGGPIAHLLELGDACRLVKQK